MNDKIVSLSKVFFVGVMMFVLAACGQVEAVPTPEPAIPEISQPIYRWGEVADRVWVLVAYDDALNPTVVEEGVVVTAVFNSVDSTVNGSGGCNNYFAGYTSSDEGALTVHGPIGASRMACETGMDVESAYLAALESVTGWTLNDEGRLELTYHTGKPYAEKLIFALGQTPLAGTVWHLVSYGDSDNLVNVLEGTAITARFSPESDTNGTVGGNATCNNYSTGYTLNENAISIGPIAGTLMMCPVGADQETAYLAALGAAQSFQIVGPNLQIRYGSDANSGVLNFTSLNLPLENVLWQAVSLLGQPIPDGVELTTLFTPSFDGQAGTVGGVAGCNNFSTGYESSMDISTNPPTQVLTITTPIAMTMMMCPDPALAQLEQTYVGALETAESYEILGEQMVVRTPGGEIRFTANRQPLEGTLWTLTSLGDMNNPQPPVPESNFTAQFSRLPTLPSGTVAGGTGCNDYQATFTANLNEIKVNLPSKTQNENCPWGTGNFEVEQQYFLGLNAATRYRIIGNTLQLQYGDDAFTQVMNFVATAPPVGPVPPALDLTPLQNTFWYLHAIGPVQVVPGTEITAQFAINADGVTGAVNGSGGCNTYNASIDPNFVVGPIASSRQSCDATIMNQETAYFEWLQSAFSFSIIGNQLLIPTQQGVLSYRTSPPVQNVPPVAVVSRPDMGDTDQVLGFSGASSTPGSSPIIAFEWQMGDGTTLSGGTAVQHAYRVPGSYQVQLTVTDQTGLSSSATHTVNIRPAVEPEAPTAVISAPQMGDTGQPLSFSAANSTPGTAAITSYAWDMGDGTSLSGQNFDYVYTAPGSYQVRLTVTDQAGLSGETTHVVDIRPAVEPEAPTAVISAPEMGDTGQPLSFSAANSTPGTAAIASYSWDMGDGTSLSGQNFDYVYTAPGSYQVRLTVTDQAGLSGETTHVVDIRPAVEPEAPTAVISAPEMGDTGQPLSFSAANSTPGTAAIASYSWDMGDGTNLTGLNFDHIYDTPGTYQVRLIVTDQANLSGEATHTIEIRQVEAVPLTD